MLQTIRTTTATLALGALMAPAALADPVAEFYDGQEVSIVVSFGAGGTYGVDFL